MSGYMAFFYKVAGARSVRIEANWQKLYFMALADKFVVKRNAFYLIAIAPFVVINTGLLFGLLFATPEWSFAIWSALFFHTGGCVGDIALMSYMDAIHAEEVVTYDDVSKKVTYFYEKQKAPCGASDHS
jgi:hypothetical protein